MKKKLLAVLLALAMIFVLVACGAETATTNDAAESAESTGDAGAYHIGVVQLVQHPALDAATEGFQDKLTELIEADGGSVEFDVQNASGDSATCATIVNGFVSNSVDLIMANATPALQAAQAGTADIPILGTSVTDYATALDIKDWDGTTGTNISGTSDLAPLEDQAVMIKQLFPDAEKVGLLYCTAEPNSVYQIDSIEPMISDLGFECERFSFTDSNDVASVVTKAAEEVDVVYIPTDNTAASCTEAIANVLVPAKIPAVCGEEGLAKGCGSFTLSIDYKELGEKTAEMAYEVLVNGADPATMEIAFAPNVTKKYNPVNVEALGLEIPKGYEAIEMDD